jgi:xanthine dehydrogenase YagR molybdenum-binding subunit
MKEAEGSVTSADLESAYAHASFGAHFAEVEVDRDTGEVRVRRMLGVFAAQSEDRSRADDRRHDMGHRLGADGGEHGRPALWLLHQPGSGQLRCRGERLGVIDVVFLDQPDPHGSPLGSKGIGELGICGAGAAVMNAIHNATGARIRNFPATPDKLLATLKSLDG